MFTCTESDGDYGRGGQNYLKASLERRAKQENYAAPLLVRRVGNAVHEKRLSASAHFTTLDVLLAPFADDHIVRLSIAIRDSGVQQIRKAHK